MGERYEAEKEIFIAPYRVEEQKLNAKYLPKWEEQRKEVRKIFHRDFYADLEKKLVAGNSVITQLDLFNAQYIEHNEIFRPTEYYNSRMDILRNIVQTSPDLLQDVLKNDVSLIRWASNYKELRLTELNELLTLTDKNGIPAVNFNEYDDSGSAFLINHIAYCNKGIVDILLNLKDKNGNPLVDINQVDKPTATSPFMWAASKDRVEIITLLLNRKDVDIKTKNANHENVLHFTARSHGLSGNIRTIQLLLELKDKNGLPLFDINEQTPGGWTVLDCYDKSKMLRFLLNHGAKYKAKGAHSEEADIANAGQSAHNSRVVNTRYQELLLQLRENFNVEDYLYQELFQVIEKAITELCNIFTLPTKDQEIKLVSIPSLLINVKAKEILKQVQTNLLNAKLATEYKIKNAEEQQALTDIILDPKKFFEKVLDAIKTVQENSCKIGNTKTTFREVLALVFNAMLRIAEENPDDNMNLCSNFFNFCREILDMSTAYSVKKGYSCSDGTIKKLLSVIDSKHALLQPQDAPKLNAGNYQYTAGQLYDWAIEAWKLFENKVAFMEYCVEGGNQFKLVMNEFRGRIFQLLCGYLGDDKSLIPAICGIVSKIIEPNTHKLTLETHSEMVHADIWQAILREHDKSNAALAEVPVINSANVENKVIDQSYKKYLPHDDITKPEDIYYYLVKGGCNKEELENFLGANGVGQNIKADSKIHEEMLPNANLYNKLGNLWDRIDIDTTKRKVLIDFLEQSCAKSFNDELQLIKDNNYLTLKQKLIDEQIVTIIFDKNESLSWQQINGLLTILPQTKISNISLSASNATGINDFLSSLIKENITIEFKIEVKNFNIKHNTLTNELCECIAKFNKHKEHWDQTILFNRLDNIYHYLVAGGYNKALETFYNTHHYYTKINEDSLSWRWQDLGMDSTAADNMQKTMTKLGLNTIENLDASLLGSNANIHGE